MRGDFTPGKTVVVRFNTHKADGTPITLAGTPACSVYKNSTTESTSGVTLTVDYDSRTGLHSVAVDTSADGTFYAAGSDFDIVITTGTVDSISVVGTVVGSFSLSNRSALRPTTADRTLAVEADGMAYADVREWLGTAPLALSSQQVQAVVPSTQKVDVETIKTRAVTAAGAVVVGGFVGQDTAAIGVNASGHVSRVTLADTVTSLTDAPSDSSGITTLLARLTSARAGYLDNINNASLAGATFPSDPADQSLVIAAADALMAAINALNNLSQAQAQAAAAAALAAYDPPTEAEMNARTLPTASYATAAAQALAKTILDKLDGMLELDGSVYRWTANALEQGPAGGGGGGGTDWTSDERAAIRAILGIPASGSTPETPTLGVLAAILAKTNTIGSGRVVFVSPVSLDGSKAIVVKGDDYSDGDGRALLWSSTTWPSLAGAAIKLVNGDLEVAGSVVGTGEEATKSVIAEPDATESAQFTTGEFRVVATLANGHVVTLKIGDLLAL